ncbi:ribonuclease III [Kiritimatiella glycovorans]|uniref:Ribonuclease 3 n=1 Tax=Kiritimatiella glycovorans TaxID=1307763 RepID=A0A0G3EJD6_9BACT|nr:ribonuclease III [Kiritimatiella glycovorans]AKJ64289.1 Ribonuclease 3 [Kiritimatiella glycovorans]
MNETHPFPDLEQQIGYRFADPDLLQRALTHPSWRHEQPAPARDNQRLEFLGDGVINLLAAEFVFHDQPDDDEGEMTKRRSALTRDDILAELGRELGLGELLRLGRGEEEHGGRNRASSLADAVEAMFGAVWLDGGTEAAREVFRRVLPALRRILQHPESWSDPKGMLQHFAHRGGRGLPQYRVLSQRGPEHRPEFEVEVRLDGEPCGRGCGPSKREAEKEAARAALSEKTPRAPQDLSRQGETTGPEPS